MRWDLESNVPDRKGGASMPAKATRAPLWVNRHPTKMGEMGLFSGLAYCADCGAKLYHHRSITLAKEQEELKQSAKELQTVVRAIEN